MASEKLDEKAIFNVARQIDSPDARLEYLSQVCGADTDLLARIETLLRAYVAQASFLESPPAGSASFTIDQPVIEKFGTQIGPYKLLQQLGEGGMGVVYLAEQSHPVQRKVALKVIKAGMDSSQVIARFEAERQALALMDHPNIAKVLDAGTTAEGRPYFVMELVKGVPITTWCDDNHLPPKARLELFTQVCQAVQHAHQKGVIHRDIKPSNVLVTQYDDKPAPKVIDFGVAKATGGRLTDRTVFTGFGQIVGTLEYMSPEQARLNALDIDTRGDIYSLGVLFYELLTGTTPFDKQRLREAAFDEMLRMIREDEPPKPSTRLSTSEGRASIAANRSMEPNKLSGLVRGELDWLVMKALEKDRNRRYESANGFAADVQRYLNDEAVLACPPSAGYRLRKFARRNKGPVWAASLVLAALVIGVVGTTWGMIRATLAEADAEREAGEKSVALIDKEAALRAAQASERTAKASEATAKKAQEEAVENLGNALAAVEQMLFRVGNVRLANVPQMETVRRELVGDALTFYEKFLKKHNADPVIRQRTATVNIRLAGLHRMLGQIADAEVYYRTGFAMFEEMMAESPLEPRMQNELVNAHRGFAQCLEQLGNREERETHLRAAVGLGGGLVNDFPQNADYRSDLAIANNALVRLIVSDHPEEAEQILRRNLALSSDEFPLGRTHHHLGILASSQGRYVEAEEAFQKALELQETVVRKNPANTNMRLYLGETLGRLVDCLAANGRPTEAEKISARTAAVWDELAADYPAVKTYQDRQLSAHATHAGILLQLNLTDEAANAYRKLMDLAAKRATDFPDVLKHQELAWNQCLILGRFLLRIGRIEEAQDVFIKAEPFVGELNADAPARFRHSQELLRTHTNLYYRLVASKDQEAQASLRQCLAILDKLEAEYGGRAEYRSALAKENASTGWLLHHAGKYSGKYLDGREKAARRVQAHVQAVAAQLADDSALRSELADSHHLLGHVLLETRAKEAEVEFRQALPLYEKLARESPKVVDHRLNSGHVHSALGLLLRSTDIAAAEQQFCQSLAHFEAASNELPANPWAQVHRATLLETVGVLRRDRGDLAGAKSLLEQAITYAQKACDLAPEGKAFRDRLQSSRAELEKTVNAHESEKKDLPK